MKPLNADFILGTVKPGEFPKSKLPEVAFSGRSNVGKSSLLNSIVLRKNLAHISSTPGKTQQINFFNVEDKWIFADLPGFGYAKVSRSLRQDWQKMTYDYITKRNNLKLVCMLVDSRHEPMESDLAIIEFLENTQKKYIVIMTKTDKISDKQVKERKEQFEYLVSQCKFCIEVLPYSSINFSGRENLLAIIKRETE
ncbi:YihA family ribosome biogenesis GTP-binding protein [Bacteroidetes/Chlorobi group bacterium ChocPot_Mid]|jgi:GTP-binding protein|nr:MAG: YihA family ribosome biogenesis GTP-binding protein [Bacteroidetes/Chlorobi group bacterium ChocPot_Mid]